MPHPGDKMGLKHQCSLHPWIRDLEDEAVNFNNEEMLLIEPMARDMLVTSGRGKRTVCLTIKSRRSSL